MYGYGDGRNSKREEVKMNGKMETFRYNRECSCSINIIHVCNIIVGLIVMGFFQPDILC